MTIHVYNPLPSAKAIDIRWPGNDVMNGLFAQGQYGAIDVRIEQESVQNDLTHYVTSPTVSQVTRMYLEEHNVALPTNRALVARVLLQVWTKVLNNDKTDIITCEEPRLRSRVRLYKGIIDTACRRSAITWSQIEVHASKEVSAIMERVQVNSTKLAGCFRHLGDIFSSFGIYGYEGGQFEEFAGSIGGSYYYEGRIWGWNPAILLPIIARESLEMFFLQGVASDRFINIVLYAPTQRLSQYVATAQEVFRARVVT